MAGIVTKAMNFMFGDRMPAKANPFQELGVSGTAIFGGFIQTKEKSTNLLGDRRYVTAADMMANCSIVAAGLRYFLNMTAKPKWSFEPVNDSAEAKAEAEFMESVIHGGKSSWSRIVRRGGLYRFHGFGIHEWTAIKRADGLIGFEDIESRPQHTIFRWQADERGTVEGVIQKSPQDGHEIWLPRGKLIYLVDDMLTDSPEGLGWFRNLVEPAERMKRYLELEGIGFERDLSGTPIGRAPITKLDQAVGAKQITQEKANSMLAALDRFVKTQVKKPNTSMTLDSMPYSDVTNDGTRTSPVAMWGLELLQATAGNMPQLAAAIVRLTEEMARIMGIENMLTGSQGRGSYALSRDKSQNLYLTINSTLKDMAEAMDRDLIDPIWALNGKDQKLKPKAKVEDVSYKDVTEMAQVLADMATAGAVLMPDDPAINDIRDALGISRQPPPSAAQMAAMLNPAPANPPKGTKPAGSGETK